MKALYARLSDSKFLLDDIPEPVIGSNPYAPRDVIVQVEYCGICGTELMLYRKGIPPGSLPGDRVGLGHEFSGTVRSVGSQVRGMNPGDRVVGEVTTGACGTCMYCREGHNNFCKSAGAFMLYQGAYSRFLPVPSQNLHLLPDGASLRAGALCQPLSLAVNALKFLARLKPGENVVIMGPGPIGLLMVMLARVYGAAAVIVTGLEKDATRLQCARDAGADVTVVADREDVRAVVMESTAGQGADVVVEISGSADAVRSGVAAVRACGRIVLAGAGYDPLTLDMAGQVMMRQLAILGCRGDPTPCWTEALRVLATGKIDIEALVSHVLPLEQWERGFELAMGGEALKVLLRPT